MSAPAAVAGAEQERDTLRAADVPTFVAHYWRVRPGRLEDCNAYIRGTAEMRDFVRREVWVGVR